MSDLIKNMLAQAEQLLFEGKYNESLQIVENAKQSDSISPVDGLICSILKCTLLNKLGHFREALEFGKQTYNESQILQKPLQMIDS